MIRKILLATDFSENANRALDFVADMAEKLDASLTIVNVIQYVPGIVIGVRVATDGCESALETGATLPENYFVEMKKMSEQTMAKVVKRIKTNKPNLKISAITKVGRSINEIISMSEEFDIIAIGHSDQDSLREAFMGANSERIVNIVKRPILVVP